MACETVTDELVLTPAAWHYLIVQQGALSPLAAGPAQWRHAYFKRLRQTMDELEQFLPSGGVQSILDVGGGMGGIDCMLSRKYAGPDVTILDGISDLPEVRTHAQTFSNASVAEAFLRENGVRRSHFIDANGALPRALKEFDLIISLQSWCFHYPPSVYMKWVLQAAKPGAVLILDVRKDRRHWIVELFSTAGLEPIGETTSDDAVKFTRLGFLVEP